MVNCIMKSLMIQEKKKDELFNILLALI